MRIRYPLFLIPFVSLFFVLPIAAQKTEIPSTKTYPNLVLKTPYKTQLQTRVNEILKKKSTTAKIPRTTIPPVVLKNISNAADFIAAFKQKNTAVGPMFLPSPYRTYLRTGTVRPGNPSAQGQVLSAFFNETEQSSLIADKDFSNQARINSLLNKDVVAAWDIESFNTGVFKISTTGTKKYLSAKRNGASGTLQITLSTDKNEQGTNWVIYSGADDGITFYNPVHHIFLARKVEGRKIFLVAFSYKEYGNEDMSKTKKVSISWDLYYQAVLATSPCLDPKFSHSMLYVLTRPAYDGDGDGHGNRLCGGDDCDDTNPLVFPGSDADGDGNAGVSCGGTDCDDYDGARFPGNPEVCDAEGHDEDCNDATYGMKDSDGDGYYDYRCFNISNGIITSSGNDCDDDNAAIFPGQQMFISDKTVDVCNVGLFEVAEGYIAVRQPNGTAVVVPKKQ